MNWSWWLKKENLKQIPIVYNDNVNIDLFGLEKIHSFDATKFRKIKDYLINNNFIKEEQFEISEICTIDDLKSIHTNEYLNSLDESRVVFNILGLRKDIFYYIPQWLSRSLLNSFIIEPMMYHVGMTLKGAELALKNKWSICLGGGMHHAQSNKGMGWCMFGDIQISIKSLINQNKIKKAMIIDVDFHQGNGYEYDKQNYIINDNPDDIYIIDFYGGLGFNYDVLKSINIKKSFGYLSFTSDETPESYLNLLNKSIDIGLNEFKPDIIYYNAGTDTLIGDPLGDLKLTKEDIIKRDEIVFKYAFKNNIPIVMILSGGYAKDNYVVIGESIGNLITKFDLNK